MPLAHGAAGTAFAEGGQGRTGLQHPLTRLTLALTMLLLLPAACAGTEPESEDKLPGWKGATYSSSGQAKKDSIPLRWIETISWSPRAFLFHNFLSPLECDHLVGLGNARVERSTIVDPSTGKLVLSTARTSFGGWFERGEDPVIAALEERISEWTHLPAENGEGIQVLRYMDGQKYNGHKDWFNDPVNTNLGGSGNRYATVLMYLGDVQEGGETVFPEGKFIDEEAQTLDNASECAAKGLAIKPKKGDAVLFFNMDIAGQQGDDKALHASCPTLKGTKWTATKWIHVRAYRGQFNALETAAKCFDTAHDCSAKESQGLCNTDPSLVGLLGSCRLTCGDCIQCPQDDIMCYRSNMKGRRQHMA